MSRLILSVIFFFSNAKLTTSVTVHNLNMLEEGISLTYLKFSCCIACFCIPFRKDHSFRSWKKMEFHLRKKKNNCSYSASLIPHCLFVTLRSVHNVHKPMLLILTNRKPDETRWGLCICLAYSARQQTNSSLLKSFVRVPNHCDIMESEKELKVWLRYAMTSSKIQSKLIIKWFQVSHKCKAKARISSCCHFNHMNVLLFVSNN